MILFVDASAMVAMMTDEAGALDLEAQFGLATDRLCSALSVWETVRAIVAKRRITVQVAQQEVDQFIANFLVRHVTIGEQELREALAAHALYGKGSHHPARLNMGDCFAYACTKTNGARLLYKGNDFVHTDLG